MNEKQVLIVAGEASGEMYGAQLVEQLRRQSKGPMKFFGCAGQAMRKAGVEAIVTVEEISVHGIVEVLSHLVVLFNGFRDLVAASAERRPDLAVLIDFPEFNIRFAARLKHLGIKVVYFISPQIWAWRRRRIAVLRELISEMICILPFEEQFYRRAGVPVRYVGHPLLQMLELETTAEEFFIRFGVDSSRPRIAVLPGSRKNEIRHNLPTVLETLAQLHAQRPELQFIVAASATVGAEFIRRAVDRWQQATGKRVAVQIIENHTHVVVRFSDAAVVSSGTATLEAALLGTPLVCIYKMSPLSWWVGEKLVDVDYYCLVNLILNRMVVAELYQSEFTPRILQHEVLRLLDDPQARRAMLHEFERLKQILQTAHSPMAKAAEIVLTHLETPQGNFESKEAYSSRGVVMPG